MTRSMQSLCTSLALVVLALWPVAAGAQDCPADFCDNPIESLCDAGGFKITLVNYTPAPPSNSGFASYTYEICSPPAGTCVSTVRPGEPCLDNAFCQRQGQNTDPSAYCTRECAVDSFRDLSHFTSGLPSFGGASCLTENTEVTFEQSGGFGSVTLNCSGKTQDMFCGFSSPNWVAKCDVSSGNLDPNECVEMTLSIAGELNAPGKGAAVVLSKESTDCNESCIAGPSCEPCEDGGDGEQCLTRTLGFWGTHPHLIQSEDPRSLNLLPITVCGDAVTVVDHGYCSTSEALCFNAPDRRSNPTYLAFAAQLTAAKLNLAATAALSTGLCSDWTYMGMGIEQWIAYCETNFCNASKQAISGSGCIQALDAFNNSQDVGFDQTPFPFDRPGPAQVGECQLARGNGIYVGGGGCMQP